MRTILATAVMLLLPVLIFAQPGDPGGDPDVPITGIEILVGIGGLYGVKKALERRPKTRK